MELRKSNWIQMILRWTKETKKLQKRKTFATKTLYLSLSLSAYEQEKEKSLVALELKDEHRSHHLRRFRKCNCSVSLLGSFDNIQENHQEQINRTILWNPLPYDSPQLYGLPFVSKDNTLVSTINGTGALIEIIYVLIFLFYAPKKEKVKIFGIFSCVLTVFATVALVSLFALHGNSRKLFCGLAATVFSIIMYASPLIIMRLVIKTKSVEFMPFFLSLFVFLCGTSWFVYGLIGRDPFVAIPNGFRFALGTLQLILYFIYCGNKGDERRRR